MRDWTKIKPGDDLWLTREQVVELHARMAELEAMLRRVVEEYAGEFDTEFDRALINEARELLKR